MDDNVTAHNAATGFRTTITAGAHTVIADEPIQFGGTDQGPDPYDLLVAALGACTAITLRMYAQRKGWPLEDVTVHLRHGRTHAQDDRDCEDAPVRIDQVDLALELQGPLSDDQRARLHEIAARCPVHRTLDAGVRINTAPA
ncbi:MAG TPA: OsmC family protein [Longimicrobiales bacterium]|nr:OsmC family protein [Longimicrobiales bacterium]